MKTVEIICIWCKGKSIKRSRGKSTAKACSKHCAGSEVNSRHKVKVKIAAAANKRRVRKKSKRCQVCNHWFYPKSSKDQRFCGHSCSAKWRMSLPRFKAMARIGARAAQLARTGKKDIKASIRMKLNNPVWMPGVLAKISKARKGCTFLSRGGNGQLTKPQEYLLDLLGWSKSRAEVPVRTLSVRSRFKSLPPCYKVDLGHKETRTAIEVDGNSHKSKFWKFIDHRKTDVLKALGWTVLRYWNEEVLSRGADIASEIRRVIKARRSNPEYRLMGEMEIQ